MTDAPELIEKARKQGSLQLDLSGLGLTVVPDSLRELRQLQSLNLSHNKLAALPIFLGELSQLLFLDLSDNQLTVF